MRKNKNPFNRHKYIFILFIGIVGYFVLHFVPCHIWNDFRGYKKSEFFGSYYGSVISALLALGGVALSLIINNFETRKVLKDSDKRLNKEKSNNLEIEIMVTNYRTLNRLMINVQRLNSYFFKASNSAKDILNNTDFSIEDVFVKILSSNNTPVKSIEKDQFTDNINIIYNAINKYHLFRHVYADQLKRVFINTPYLHGYKKKLEANLKNLDKDIRKVNVSFHNSIKSNNSKIQKTEMKKSYKYIKDVINNLSDLDKSSLDFGTRLEEYLRDKK